MGQTNADLPTTDILDQIPGPDELDRLLAESIRRTAMLRTLARVSRKKSVNTLPSGSAASTKEVIDVAG